MAVCIVWSKFGSLYFLFPLPTEKKCLVLKILLKNGAPPGSRRGGSHDEKGGNLNNPSFAFVAKSRSLCQDSLIHASINVKPEEGGPELGKIRSNSSTLV